MALSLPPLRWGHLVRLTDEFGIIQHCVGSVPDPRTGYTMDDTARAIIAAIGIRGTMSLDETNGHQELASEIDSLLTRFLASMAVAQKQDGSFHNFLSYAKRPLDERGTHDTQGHAVWGLGVAACDAGRPGHRHAARRMLRSCLYEIHHLRSPRGLALSLLGLNHLVSHTEREDPFAPVHEGNGDSLSGVMCVRARDLIIDFAGRLCEMYEGNSEDDWNWFESYLTYANARLPEAMLRCGKTLGRSDWIEVGLKSLEFLTHITLQNGMLEVIGNHGWMTRGRAKALFDQQCVDSGAMVEAYLAAWDVTGNPDYLERADVCLEWFHGRNIRNVDLYLPSGSCYDGITPEGVNTNQGAESILAYLMSRVAFDRARAGVSVGAVG